jgi:hypothetical protein
VKAVVAVAAEVATAARVAKAAAVADDVVAVVGAGAIAGHDKIRLSPSSHSFFTEGAADIGRAFFFFRAKQEFPRNPLKYKRKSLSFFSSSGCSVSSS